MSIVVDVQYALEESGEDHSRVPRPAMFRRWARAVLKGRRPEAELSIRIVAAAEGAELNQTYRHKTGPTNVLSFPCESPPGLDLPLLGDLVICAPVVAREAREQAKSVEAHWAHMTVHGMLHLLGYDHELPQEAEAMEKLETLILAELGFPDPYVAGFALEGAPY